MIFGSDNMVGASPQVLQTLAEANVGEQASYGNDRWCDEAARQIGKIFEREVAVFFVSSGTVANSLALSALVPPWGAIYAQTDAHILNDESTAPELFTGGARLLGLPPQDGKLQPSVLRAALAQPGHPPHGAVAAALSLTQCNERGRVYRPAEIRALAEVAKARGLKLHMDGARFANALVSLDCAPADITWRAGIDVLSLGASKNGALMAEAVVFFQPELARDFAWRLKRAGQMAAKGRFFGAQYVGWLKNDHWLELARHANHMAQKLAAGLQSIPGMQLAWPTEANEVFVRMPRTLAQAMWDEGAIFFEWPHPATGDDLPLAPDTVLARFVASYATQPEQIEQLLALARRHC